MTGSTASAWAERHASPPRIVPWQGRRTGPRQGLADFFSWLRHLNHLAVATFMVGFACPAAAADPASAAGGDGCRSQGMPRVVTEVYTQIPGVDPRHHALDIHTPIRNEACPPTPVVVYFHGGGYVMGDKANQLTDKVALFSGSGWTFVSANYRLSPKPDGAEEARSTYPDAQNDAAAAVAHLVRHALRLNIDPSRIVLMGHSAGAHLAALVSTDRRHLAAAGIGNQRIRCTVVLDTDAYDLPELIRRGGDRRNVFRNAIGSGMAELEAASPMRHVSAGVPPHFIVARGSQVRRDQAQAYHSAVQAFAPEAQLLTVRGYTHAEVNSAIGKPGETTVTVPLMAFLRRCAS